MPLAATWLMMAAEGPFLAAVIARLADPKFNLAAHGVAYAFAILVEAPVIMLMSASTALAEGHQSFRRLRRFSYALSLGVTALMVVVLLPPVFETVMLRLIALPEEVARLTHTALWILLPWPGAIGYRRFYQGIMIRDGQTRLVAVGTVVRLTAMASTALVLYLRFDLPGAHVGAAALATGVSLEAVVSRWMARASVQRLLATPEEEPIDYRKIAHFYYPLALTSLIGLVVQPMLTFFMGRAPAPVESLAVFPVVHALSFVFRAMGLSYQEVAIALIGKRFEHLESLTRFAVTLGLASSAGLALVALTPLSGFWFGTVSGLSPELTRFAVVPTAILIPIPLLSVILSHQRALLVIARETRPITWATVLEVTGVAVGFPVLGHRFGWVGVTAAVTAFVVGRLAGTAFLTAPCVRAVRGRAGSGEP